jgi:hypothetical protein
MNGNPDDGFDGISPKDRPAETGILDELAIKVLFEIPPVFLPLCLTAAFNSDFTSLLWILASFEGGEIFHSGLPLCVNRIFPVLM